MYAYLVATLMCSSRQDDYEPLRRLPIISSDVTTTVRWLKIAPDMDILRN